MILFPLGLVLRASAIAALTIAAVQLAADLHLYMTASALIGVAALLCVSLWRAVKQADRVLARLVDREGT